MALILIVQSLVATFVVSVIPVLLLNLLPNLLRDGKTKKKTRGAADAIPIGILNAMLSFAAGSLLGDAIFHLLGHHDHGHGHEQMVPAAVLFGIGLFFAIDRISHSLCRHNHKGHDHDHSKAISGYLSLIADAFHNFTDGLAVASSFRQSFHLGITTTLAIFLHEIPHELGDYAILIKAGFPHGQVLRMQLATAAAAPLGALCGLAIGAGWLPLVSEASLLPFAAGGFIYVALCSILSEVTNTENTSRILAANVVFSFFIGVLLMLLIES